MRSSISIVFVSLLCLICESCGKGAKRFSTIQKEKQEFAGSGNSFSLDTIIEVSGRQGVATDGKFYYISSSTALYKYDKNGKLLLSNEKPFTQLKLEANHFGDIDVYNGDIYTGIETFVDGVGKNIQIAVYDANTLQYKYSIPWNEKSGQVEVCGLTVDKDHNRIWMADWVQGHELYCYDLKSHKYIGKTILSPAPRLQQGICYWNGQILISCDDGDAEEDKADNIYIADIYPEENTDALPDSVQVRLWRNMSDFKRTGEIEGLTIDHTTGNFIVLSNRGARIILGMPKGFYEGYSREIHEIYIYKKGQEK